MTTEFKAFESNMFDAVKKTDDILEKSIKTAIKYGSTVDEISAVTGKSRQEIEKIAGLK